jgi:hypothetical protein
MIQNKIGVPDIITQYDSKLVDLQKQRDRVVSEFAEFLKEKRLEELRKSIQSKV